MYTHRIADLIHESIALDIENFGSVVRACAIVVENHDNNECHSAGCMALRVGPSCGGPCASARLLCTMASLGEPPAPHYIDDQGVTRDVRTQVACIPYTDGWGFVRNKNTGLKIIVAREETAKIPGILAGLFSIQEDGKAGPGRPHPTIGQRRACS